MADNGGFDAEQGNTTSFSQLFSDDVVLGLDFNNSYPCSSGHEKPPKMLCFGDYNQIVVYGETTTTGTAAATQKSGITCSDSSSASSGNNSSSANALSKSTKKRNGSGQESVPCPNLATATTHVASQRNSKKTKAGENPLSSTGHVRAKKEKLGDRITALQQLVSPFGKTDTASVLHEAMGYIRFLHDQVQILCSPYLQHHLPEGGENRGEESRKDLQSKGLCLVPVADTVHVANSNGADFWSRAMGSNVSPSAACSNNCKVATAVESLLLLMRSRRK